MDSTEIIMLLTALMLGVGLSAAAGFRVFLPFLCVSISSYFKLWDVPPNMLWAGTLPALVLFSTATLLETAAYYIPWVDNILDMIATPAAAIAGSILTATAIGGDHVPPMLQWSAGIMAGGTTAAIVSGSSSLTRAASSLTTGGVANPLVSTMEIIGSIFFSILALILPVVAGVIVVFLAFFTGRFLWKRFFKSKNKAQNPENEYVVEKNSIV